MARFLVTAGNAQAPIDAVRCLTNVFTGRTGYQIAVAAAHRGHMVTLATSHPEWAQHERDRLDDKTRQRLRVESYRTFDDLHELLAREITQGSYDALVHSAAVTDFRVAEIVIPDPHDRGGPESPAASPHAGLRRLPGSGKIKSDAPELWLRLVPTPKLVDCVRQPWGFRGVLVKFKLEVGIDPTELRRIALASCQHSEADLIVANTWETRHAEAFLGRPDGSWRRVERSDLAEALVHEIEAMMPRKNPGINDQVEGGSV